MTFCRSAVCYCAFHLFYVLLGGPIEVCWWSGYRGVKPTSLDAFLDVFAYFLAFYGFCLSKVDFLQRFRLCLEVNVWWTFAGGYGLPLGSWLAGHKEVSVKPRLVCLDMSFWLIIDLLDCLLARLSLSFRHVAFLWWLSVRCHSWRSVLLMELVWCTWKPEKETSFACFLYFLDYFGRGPRFSLPPFSFFCCDDFGSWWSWWLPVFAVPGLSFCDVQIWDCFCGWAVISCWGRGGEKSCALAIPSFRQTTYASRCDLLPVIFRPSWSYTSAPTVAGCSPTYSHIF